jgi:hypothetical protein
VLNCAFRPYNFAMRVQLWLCLTIIALPWSPAAAYPRPAVGTENIPKLVADSTLVCKGEVTEAPDVTSTPDTAPPHLTAIALVEVSRCFKGEPPPSNVIPVLFDGVIPVAPSPYVVLRRGDYRLFFLKPQNERSGKYVMVDQWFGQLTISRLLTAPTSDADPLRQLELDLKAGLQDADHDRLLDSIRMLGNMRHLQSTAELTMLLDSPDPLVRTYVYEAMLRLHDYSVLPAVEQWLIAQPLAPRELFLPRDALFNMQRRLGVEISGIRDPSTISILLRLLQLPDPILRHEVLGAVRAMHSLESAPSLLMMLDDPDANNAFSAMQSLFELAGGGVIDWVPSLPEFRSDPTYYAAKCREWWQAEGEQKAKRPGLNVVKPDFSR